MKDIPLNPVFLMFDRGNKDALAMELLISYFSAPNLAATVTSPRGCHGQFFMEVEIKRDTGSD